MNSETQLPGDAPERAAALIGAVVAEIRKVVVGQDDVIAQAITGLVAGGHVLVEGVPGLGKTLLVKALARTLRGNFARIQFTPDLMPSDVTGHTIYDGASGKFVARKGPVFTNFLLADEINRAPAKTQAALLEVMQEAQVTIEGTAHALTQPFMVFATQNPIEHEGTYPLPDAQLDRFLLNVRIGYPGADEEVRLTRQVTQSMVGDKLNVDAVQPVHRARAGADPAEAGRHADRGRQGGGLRRAPRARDTGPPRPHARRGTTRQHRAGARGESLGAGRARAASRRPTM